MMLMKFWILKYHMKKVEYDSSKASDFNEITTAGVTGITRIDENYTVKNGQTQGGVEIVSSVKIKEKVDQVTTKRRL